MATLTVTLPDYISIKSYKAISSLEHLDSIDKMVKTITMLSDLTEDKVREFPINDITTLYNDIVEKLTDALPEFYPLYKLEDKMYGYSSISKMNAGEYADLENLLKDPMDNLEEIMALLYRPVTKNTFGSLKWSIKKSIAIANEEAENLFAFYEIEKYDSSERRARAKEMGNLPISFALGALSFFLVVGTAFIENSQASSLSKKELKKVIQKIKKTPTAPIGVGLSLLTNLRRVPSLQSQEIHELQI